MPKVRFDAAKWGVRSGGAGSDYEKGISNPRRSQSAAAIDAEPVYEAALQAAIGRKAFSKGLAKAGDAKWSKGAKEKGRTRYQSQVMMSQNEYAAGFRPFISVIEGVSLAPRGPKGQNYGRVQQIGEALRLAKEGA